MSYVQFLNESVTYDSNTTFFSNTAVNYGFFEFTASNITVTFDYSGNLIAGGGGGGGSNEGDNGNNGGHAIYIPSDINGIIIKNYAFLFGGGGGGGGYYGPSLGSAKGGDGGSGGGGGGAGTGINSVDGGTGGTCISAGSINSINNSSEYGGGGGGWGYSGAGFDFGVSNKDGDITVGGGGNAQNGYVYGGGAGSGGGVYGGGGGAGFGKGNFGVSAGGGGGGSGGGSPNGGGGLFGGKAGTGGYGGYGIFNEGELKELWNGQGTYNFYNKKYVVGGNGAPLYLGGNLPIDYYICIINNIEYGQLFCTPAIDQTMTFHLSTDEITSIFLSTITIKTTLKNVLVGMNISNTSGTYNNGNWNLIQNNITNPNNTSYTFTCYDLELSPTYTSGFYCIVSNTKKNLDEIFAKRTTSKEIRTNYYNGTNDIGSIYQYQPIINQSTLTTTNLFTYIDYYSAGTWTQSEITVNSELIYSVSISSNSEYAYAGSASAVGGPSYIYKSSNYGENWTQLTKDNGLTWNKSNFNQTDAESWLNQVSISTNGQYGLACIQIQGYIFSSDDYGVNWTKYTSLSQYLWSSVSISSTGQYGLACSSISSISSSTGNIYYTTDYGVSWTLSSVDIAASWISVSISSDSAYGLACDSPNGYIYYTSNYGANWTKSLSISANWNSVSISSTGQYGLACEYNGNTYFSSTYGQTWVNIKTSNPSTSNPSTTVSISGTGNYGLSCNLNSTSIYNITNTSPSLVDLNQIFAPI